MSGDGLRLVEILASTDAVAIDAFIRRWHGIDLPAEPPAGALPPLVRRLIAAHRIQPRLVAQNELVDDYDGEPEEGLRSFYREYPGSGGWWAVPDGAHDLSPVWAWKGEDGHLTLETEPLARFVLQVVLFESIFSAPFWAAADFITLSQLKAVLEPLTPLPLAGWRAMDATVWLYAGDDTIAVVMTNGDERHTDHFSVDVASLQPDALAYLTAVPIAIANWRRLPPAYRDPF